MKEFVMKEIKPGIYEYGYKIQKLDIEFMIELNLQVPDKLREIYNQGFSENELPEYVYFNDSIVREYIKRQYYIRNYEEFANMNIYELELLLSFYKKRLLTLTNRIAKIKNKEKLNDLQIDINILINEMLGIIYLRDNLKNIETKKIK
ncbi:MAG: hypothetical protein IJ068_05820 [Bacilli bacterium]|nr:hypothetical protein [Bacilli bacterium]